MMLALPEPTPTSTNNLIPLSTEIRVDTAFLHTLRDRLIYPTRDCCILDMIQEGTATIAGFDFGYKDGSLFMRLRYRLPHHEDDDLPYLLLRVGNFSLKLD